MRGVGAFMILIIEEIVFGVPGLLFVWLGFREIRSTFAVKPSKKQWRTLRTKTLYRLTTKDSDLGGGKVRLQPTQKKWWRRDPTAFCKPALFFFTEEPTQDMVNQQNLYSSEVLVQMPFVDLENFSKKKVRYRKKDQCVIV
jgi:hypothetical protein